MQKAYKVVGVSRNHPGNLPAGFSIVEKEVGEVHQIPQANGQHINVVEAKNGNIVIYKEGVQGVSFQIRHEDLPGFVQFVNRVWVEHR